MPRKELYFISYHSSLDIVTEFSVSDVCLRLYMKDFLQISALEHHATDYKVVTLPATKRVDFLYHFKVNYGDQYDIKVSTNFPGSKATDVITYKVPEFLQPYKVRVAANEEEGAFMIYWTEPFVPYYVNKVYYEVCRNYISYVLVGFI